MIKAPFTEDQVQSLNEYQKCGVFHPFTCSGGGGPHGDLPGRSSVLVADRDGWHCPVDRCDHFQDWAFEGMADGSWRSSVQWVKEALHGPRRNR